MSDAIVYGGFTRAALDTAYDNRGHVPANVAMRPGWLARSEALYAKQHVDRDLRYGTGPRHRLDFFYADAPDRPTLAYIHGGYWHLNDKEPNAFVAAGPLALGMNVVLIEYTLAPQTNMDGIVGEIRAAVEWLAPRLTDEFGASKDLVVSGHSAGGHLSAMALEWPGTGAALLISGLYDLEPIRHTTMNDKIGLDAESARRNSPMLRTPLVRPTVVAYGQAELPELQRQSEAYADYLRARSHPVETVALPRANHFSILETLANADGALARAALALAEVARDA